MSDAPRDLETAKVAARQFAEMARKIEENATNGFSGAVVVVPPAGEPINLLLVSSLGDEALFWATLKTQVEMRFADLQQRQSQPTGWR